jgi:hypothetical protein
MLKSALLLMAAASAGSADVSAKRASAFVLFSGGVPALQINTDSRACPLEAPKRSSAQRTKPVFALY